MMEAVVERSLIQAFEAFGTPQGEMQKAAYDALQSLPVPSRRTEAWKYTPVNKIAKAVWKRPEQQGIFDIHSLDLPTLDCYQVLIVDGKLDAQQSAFPQVEGITCMPLSEAMIKAPKLNEVYGQQADWKGELFIAANTAFAEEGVYLHAGRNAKLDKPLHIVHVSSQAGTAAFGRHIIDLEQSASVEMVYSHFHLAGPAYSNVVSEIRVADNARFTMDKFQSGTNESYHYASEEVFQGRDATSAIHNITIDGAWTRNDPRIRIQGQNSICHINGSYLPMGNELVDNHSIIDHLVPNCESHEMFKGVVYDSAKGVFNGKVFVRPDAQKTNAYQQNANIVMSDKASMNSKPELEIYADDVKCSHGSTTGQIDTEALFYLQCRGLSKAKAKQLLIHAFVGEVIEQMPEGLQDYAWARIEEKLARS